MSKAGAGGLHGVADVCEPLGKVVHEHLCKLAGLAVIVLRVAPGGTRV
jgi:hypothetical protein